MIRIASAIRTARNRTTARTNPSPYLPITLVFLALSCAANLGNSGQKAAPSESAAVNRPLDTVVTNYTDGKVMEKYTAITKKNGDKIRQGLYQLWNEDGAKVAEYECKDDKKDGLYHSWYPNGQMETEGHYKDDQPDGKMQSWYSDGQIQKEEDYKMGVRDGEYWEHYDSDKMKCEGHYVDGRENGIFYDYFPNGDPKLLREYDHGKLVNEQTEFKRIPTDAKNGIK